MSDLKTRTRIGNTLDTNLLKKLKDLSGNTRIPMSRLLDEAVEDLIQKHNTTTYTPSSSYKNIVER
ncbi:ribbon-helix-helix domain-containing protein [Metabacillus rhizolycopersici]|uniref:Ribbon-helix-helix domain-containing protein n=1 Tax=Metabacillus rhizolycopersici TaxID=2875709 RepID=A0ABS7UZG2_9BACI|nr:ribbon-helix-helix domain-containing protein [Metabacillus rhizolycopersici]MBZ5753521.1 ribbon-helix-helix domain-containing protein [Metabacillus rhizolycopersici]